MTRNEYDIALCYDEDTNEFDWDKYQYLCDIAEYWECEEEEYWECEEDEDYDTCSDW